MRYLLSAYAALPLALFASLFPNTSIADPVLSGGQTIFVAGSNSKCVVPSQDAVSITVTSIRLPNVSSIWPTWLKKADQLGAKVDLSINGPTGSNDVATFPIGKTITPLIADNNAAILRGTIKIQVLTSYKLADSRGNFAHIDMPLTLARIDNNKGLDAVFSAIQQAGKSASLPASPFSPIVAGFSTLFQNVYTANTENSESFPNAIIGFDIANQASDCDNDNQMLKTGAEAQIFSAPQGVANTIDIRQYYKYCYYSTDDVDPNIMYIPKPSSNVCQASMPNDSIELQNPQIIFVINAHPIITNNQSQSVAITHSSADAIFSASNMSNVEFLDASKRSRIMTADGALVADKNSLTALKKKVAPLNFSSPQSHASINLTPQERAALSASIALKNCKLVGLQAQECN